MERIVFWPRGATVLARPGSKRGPTFFAALILGLALWNDPALAHRDDYVDETFVYQTLAHREFELELWAEIQGGKGRLPRTWYTSAFEYGITGRWTIDGATQWVHGHEETGFGRLRLETRYRFREEGKGPLDLAASLEYELETERALGAETEQTLTPRLVVSKDLLRDFNTTLNLDVPVTVAPDTRVAFRYAVGARYPAEGFLRVGAEWKHAPKDESAILFPQAWFAFPHGVTFKLGAGIGMGSVDEPWIGRAVLEAEF